MINLILNLVQGEARERAKKFQQKLDDINIGIVTYGLAFHIHKTQVLRYPYHEETYFEKVLSIQFMLCTYVVSYVILEGLCACARIKTQLGSEGR